MTVKGRKRNLILETVTVAKVDQSHIYHTHRELVLQALKIMPYRFCAVQRTWFTCILPYVKARVCWIQMNPNK